MAGLGRAVELGYLYSDAGHGGPFYLIEEEEMPRELPGEATQNRNTGGVVPQFGYITDYVVPTGAHKTPFLSVIDEIVAMHDKKQIDYGTTADPFANVRASEAFGIEPWIGTLVRAHDKMKRLQKASRGGQMANESVRDSLLDLATYAVIATVLYDECHPPTNQGVESDHA